MASAVASPWSTASRARESGEGRGEEEGEGEGEGEGGGNGGLEEAPSPGSHAMQSHEHVGRALPSLPLTVPKPFSFALEGRMEERAQYDQGVRERQRAAEEREGLEQAQRQEEERRELLEYRKTLDFKATPINRYKAVAISPSRVELTVPRAPPLHSSQRSRGAGGKPSSTGSSLEGSLILD